MKPLIVIPARGGSKGIPGKNIKCLGGKPLLEYTIDTAKSIAPIEDICISTDEDKIIEVAINNGLDVPFKRPDYLATDTAGTYEVLLHALKYYEDNGKDYDTVILLQTTSPFRTVLQVKEAISRYTPDIDMVVSVKEASANPYYNCFEENENGYLEISKGDGKIRRRQDAPRVWEYNGAIYVINAESLKSKPMSLFGKVIKYPMNEISSIDLDTPLDWEIAELIINKMNHQ